MLSQADRYSVLLEHMRVMIYHGLDDPFFVRPGEEAFANSLKWSGQEGFLAAPREAWAAPDDPEGLSGYVRSYKNLTWCEVREAGHLVPGDQPLRAWTMVQNFIEQRPWT